MGEHSKYTAHKAWGSGCGVREGSRTRSFVPEQCSRFEYPAYAASRQAMMAAGRPVKDMKPAPVFAMCALFADVLSSRLSR